jgi:hypothetical protein
MERFMTFVLIGLTVALIIAIYAVVVGPPAPLDAGACRPTLIQPASGARPALVARIDGCPGLIYVTGDTPGTLLAVPRPVLTTVDDHTIDALPSRPPAR